MSCRYCSLCVIACGRGSIIDIFSVSILINCGNLFSEVRRRKFFILVTRGSFCVVWVIILSFFIIFMERNFYILIGLLFMS